MFFQVGRPHITHADRMAAMTPLERKKHRAMAMKCVEKHGDKKFIANYKAKTERLLEKEKREMAKRKKAKKVGKKVAKKRTYVGVMVRAHKRRCVGAAKRVAKPLARKKTGRGCRAKR